MAGIVQVVLLRERDDAASALVHWLEKRLTAFRTPAVLVRRGLPAQIAVISSVEDADHAIVVCTAGSAASASLAAAIEAFVRLRPIDRVLTVLAKGTSEGDIPDVLRGDVPLAATFSRDRRSSEELLRIIASLIGCTFDELRRREQRRRRVRMRIAAAAMAMVVLLVLAARFSFRHFAAQPTREEIVVLRRGLPSFHPFLGSGEVVFDTNVPLAQLSREGIAAVRRNAPCLPVAPERWLSCTGATNRWRAPALLAKLRIDPIWDQHAFQAVREMRTESAALRAVLLQRIADCRMQMPVGMRGLVDRSGAASEESDRAFAARSRCGPDSMPRSLPLTTPVSERVAHFRELLKGPGSGLFAAQELIELGDTAPEIESVLEAGLRSESPGHSFWAAKLLLKRRPADRAALTRVWHELGKPWDPQSPTVIGDAADSLTAAKTADVDAEALRTLFQGAASTGRDEAIRALDAIRRLRIHHPLYREKLETLLRSAANERRFVAAETLLALDAGHAGARTALRELLVVESSPTDPLLSYGVPPLFARAADALRGLPGGAAEVAEVLRQRLTDPDPAMAMEAARILATRPENRTLLVDALVARLPQLDENHLLAAADILLACDAKPAVLVTALERAVEIEVHPPPVVGLPLPPGGPDAYDFAERLGRIGPLPASTLSLLREALERGRGYRAEGFARAVLLRAGESDRAAATRLLDELSGTEAAASAPYRSAVILAIALIPNLPKPDPVRTSAVTRWVNEWSATRGQEGRELSEAIEQQIQYIATRGPHYLR